MRNRIREFLIAPSRERSGMGKNMALIKLSGLAKKMNDMRRMLLYGPRYSTESYIRQLRRLGADIHESVKMVSPETILIDPTMPYLLRIGKNVSIAANVTILTHDAGWLVMKADDGVVRGHVAPVTIGNNVFIGMYSIILCNVTICDNVIISAGSVVTSSLREPGVYAGNPARLVIPYDRYLALREGRQVQEAYRVAKAYYERYGKKPPQEIFGDYFWIFYPRRDIDRMPEVFSSQLKIEGNYEVSRQKFMESEPDFDGYDAFWDWCFGRIEKKRSKNDAG